jgi:Rieske Fe-S protein
MRDEQKRGKESEPVPLDRRRFLLLSGSLAAGLWIGPAGCGSGADPQEPDSGLDADAGQDSDGDAGPDGGADAASDSGVPPGVLVGQVGDFATGSVSLIAAQRLFVLRDADGLYAMTAVCTHQQCTVGTGQDRLPCPCHGSVFDLDGKVVNGPAVRPLVHYLVILDGQDVRVDKATIVPAADRTPV